MLKSGQYRKVKDTDDGGSVWSCLWCGQSMELRDNPEWSRWNFCPLCGGSWFNKLVCRDHHTPRWYFDRWGDPNGRYGDKVKTTTGEHDPYQLIGKCHEKPEPQAVWVIEERTKWFDQPWSEWRLEWDMAKDPCKPDYQWALSQLRQCRLRVADSNVYEDDVKYEYRLRLVRKQTAKFSLTSGLSEVDCNIVRDLYHKYWRPKR